MSSEERREQVRQKREREAMEKEYQKLRHEHRRRMEANKRIQDRKILVDYMEGKFVDDYE